MTLTPLTNSTEPPDARPLGTRRPSLIAFVQRVLLGVPEEQGQQVIMAALGRCAHLDPNDPAQIQREVLRAAYELAHEALERRPEWYLRLRLERATQALRSFVSRSQVDDRFSHFSRLARALVTLRGFGFTETECAFIVGLTPAEAAGVLTRADTHPDYANVIHVISALLNAGAVYPEAAIAAMLADDTTELLTRQPELRGLFTALEDLVSTHSAATLTADTVALTTMISYNSKDRVPVERLRREILRQGGRVWMDREEPGVHAENIYRVLAKILGTAQAFIVIRGPHGPGQYQRDEMDVILDQVKRRGVPVVVVVPETVEGEPLPLGEFWDPRSYVDLRGDDYERKVRYILEALGMSRRIS